MRAHNLEALPSDDLKAHPLWPNIYEWMLTTPSPCVSWNHPPDFSAAVKALRVDEVEKKFHRLAFNESEALGRAMVGGTYNPTDHAALYHVTGHRLGRALCYAAGLALACGPVFFSSFAVSSRLPGFLDALEAWAGYCFDDTPLTREKSLSLVYREIIAKELPGGNFWLKVCIDRFADPKDAFDAIADEKRRAHDAEKKRSGRNSPRKPAKHLERIARGWLPLSLWARTSKDIAHLLEPDLIDSELEERQVGGTVSEFHKKAGVSPTHRGREYGGIIERAERAAKKSLP